MYDVVTVGSATLDIFLKSSQFKIDRHVQGVYLCEPYESKLEAQEIVMVSGGGATNSAVSYARKGLSAAPIIEMGQDPAAETIISELTKEKVDLSLVIQEPDEVTAVSVILLSAAGGNSIITYRGASRMITESDIPFSTLGMKLKPNGWLHLTNLGGNLKLVKKILSWTKEKNRRIFWNPGRAEIENLGKTKFPAKGLPDILQLNRQEAADFFGVDFLDDSIWKSEHCPTPPEVIAIITDGANGGRICHRGTCTWYQGIKTVVSDATGAGDAFGSGFTAALISGQDVAHAIEQGKKQAANVVRYLGAKKGLLSGVPAPRSFSGGG